MTAKAAQCIFFVLFIFSCSSSHMSDVCSLQLKKVNGDRFDACVIKKDKASAFIFLSPDCPLSQKYSLIINDAVNSYADKKIAFYLVFSGKLYSDDEIKKFLSEYDLHAEAIKDGDKQLASALSASVTPEVFLLDPSGKKLYSGAIDNWFSDVSTKRETITEHYLADAIDSFLAGASIKIPETKPTGCIIE